jgi:hypothetical protein
MDRLLAVLFTGELDSVSVGPRASQSRSYFRTVDIVLDLPSILGLVRSLLSDVPGWLVLNLIVEGKVLISLAAGQRLHAVSYSLRFMLKLFNSWRPQCFNPHFSNYNSVSLISPVKVRKISLFTLFVVR